MLKARLPTQQELSDLYREVETLRKDKKLKDDTIKFLQKEKEALQRELMHYEQKCEGIVKSTTNERHLEGEIKQLQADILHLKDVIRTQARLLKNVEGPSTNASLDRKLVYRMCGNLMELLEDVNTPMSIQIKTELGKQKDQAERGTPTKNDSAFYFVEVADRAILELRVINKMRSSDLPGVKAAINKYSSNSTTAGSSGSNLLSVSSTSLANLSPDANQSRKKSQPKMAQISAKLERSHSAPVLNGITPRPPATPRKYRNDSTFTTTINMLDTLKAYPPGLERTHEILG